MPDKNHEWLLDTSLVAQGYGVTDAVVRKHKERHAAELKEGKHWVSETKSHTSLSGTYETKSVFWTKKGVVRLGFFIKSGKAAQFRDWAEDLIIEAAKTAIAAHRPTSSLEVMLEPHTRPEVQKQNSNDVNRYCFTRWDRQVLIKYNQLNCLTVTGMRPSHWVEIGRNAGLKSVDYASGKQVLRKLKPAWAAVMSANDELVQRGMKLGEANRLTKPCLPLLEKMIELKMLNT